MPVRPFSLLVAYRDKGHEQLAKDYCDEVCARLSWPMNVRFTEWKFEMLEVRSLREMATVEAEQSGLIVIATRWGELCLRGSGNG